MCRFPANILPHRWCLSLQSVCCAHPSARLQQLRNVGQPQHMEALRYVFPISYVFFVVLLAGTLILFDPLDLTDGMVLALMIPALLAAFFAFVVQPIFEQFRRHPSFKRRINGPQMAYQIVLALVMLFAPIAIAIPVFEVSPPLAFATLLITSGLLILNTLMLLFAGYFIDDTGDA